MKGLISFCDLRQMFRQELLQDVVIKAAAPNGDTMRFDNDRTVGKWRGTARSFAVGFGVFSLGAVWGTWLNAHNVRGLLALSDDVLTGIVAGLFVLLYERWQQREVEQKLRTIRLMNHHVRNALQVVSASASCLDSSPHASAVSGAVKRIEWALSNVLPGASEEATDFLYSEMPSKGPAAS